MSIQSVSLAALGREHPISPHFTLGEFASKDGADIVRYSTDLLAGLEELRAYGGFTITINSGYRTAAHNKAVGGAASSRHVEGTAADIVVRKDGKAVNAKLICCLCQSLGFPGVAYISKTAVHVDVREKGRYRGDERKGYSGNVGGDFYRYFSISKAEVEALKTEKTENTEKEERAMTREQFDEMMKAWLAQQAAASPGAWSEEARRWAEEKGLILGDGAGDKAYGRFCTREEVVMVVYRLFGGII